MVRSAVYQCLALVLLLLFVAACRVTPSSTPQALPPSPSVSRPSTTADYVRRFDPASSLRFERFSVEQGLSQSSVRCIAQDHDGFIWFGTEDGLNRFDGSQFKVYKHDPANPNTLVNNAVNALAEDSLGNLWVGTEASGLDRFDVAKQQFTHYSHSAQNPDGLSDDYIYALHEDTSGVLWVGTGGGLNRLNLKDGRWSNFRGDASAPPAIRQGLITTIFESRSSVLWFGTTEGLVRYNPGTGTFIPFRNDPADATSLSNNGIWAVAEDSSGSLWVGTMGGINILNADETRFTRIQSRSDDATTISSNSITAIRLDRSGTMWIATYDRGINRYDAERKRFVRYAREADNPASLSNDYVRTIYEDRSGNLWIGTFGGGVNLWSPATARFLEYRSRIGQPGLSHSMVFSIYADSNDVVWVGTEAGLDRLDRTSGQFKHYKYDAQDPTSLGPGPVNSIYRDRAGTLWVGTESGGLNRFDAEKNGFVHYLYNASNRASLSSNGVVALYEDARGNFWVGTRWGLDRMDRAAGTFEHYAVMVNESGTPLFSRTLGIVPEQHGGLWLAGTSGLAKFDPSTGKMTNYLHKPQDANSLSGDFVLAVHQDRSGIVWAGTYTEGLDRFDPSTGQFKHYREKQGLPNDTVYAILEDLSGFLWMSTNKGIAKFDPRTETFSNYDAADGLQGNEFNWGAYHSSAHGEMFFGGTNGLTAFNPEDIADQTVPVPVMVTGLTRAGESLQLSQAVESVREISLAWPDNYFEFEFAGLDLARSRKLQYAYMLEGFDQRWNEVGNRNAGRYTNLPGGTYSLHVVTTDGKGPRLGNGATLKINVIPPLWDAWWVRGGALLVLALAGLLAYRSRVTQVQARNRELQVQVEERTRALGEQTAELEERTRELSRQGRRLEALYRADEEMYKHLTVEQVLKALVEVAVDICSADKSSALVWHEAREEWIVCATRGFGPETVALLHFRKDEGMIGQVASTGQVVTVQDAAEDPRRAQERSEAVQAVLDEGVRSFMQIPIMQSGQVFAVFNVNSVKISAFGPEEQRLFLALAQRAERAIENARLFDTESRRAEQFQIIAEMGRSIAGLLDTNQILRQVVTSIQQRFGYYHVAIGLVEDSEVVYRVGSGILWDNPHFGFRPARLKIGKEGITGWVAAHGEPLIVPDVNSEPRYVWMQGSTTRSELAVPILLKEEVIGVLDVESDQLNAFDSTDLAVIQALANQTSAAIERARLYERAQELAVLEERNRLARDLHDAVTQTLFSATLIADAIPPTWESDPSEGRQLLRELRQLSRGALAEMRTLLLELRPAALVEVPLGALLKQLGEATAGREGLLVAVNITGDHKLPAEAHVAFYRIAQEALNNAIKHARATHVIVSLDCAVQDRTTVVQLSVSDDGHGFDVSQLPPGHFGLVNMKERAASIGAKLNVDSAPGQGTRVQLAWESGEVGQ